MTYCSQSWDAIIVGDTSDQPSRYTQGHRSTGYVSLNKPLFRVMVRWARYFTVFCFACFKPTKTLNNSIENSIRESRQTRRIPANKISISKKKENLYCVALCFEVSNPGQNLPAEESYCKFFSSEHFSQYIHIQWENLFFFFFFYCRFFSKFSYWMRQNVVTCHLSTAWTEYCCKNYNEI